MIEFKDGEIIKCHTTISKHGFDYQDRLTIGKRYTVRKLHAEVVIVDDKSVLFYVSILGGNPEMFTIVSPSTSHTQTSNGQPNVWGQSVTVTKFQVGDTVKASQDFYPGSGYSKGRLYVVKGINVVGDIKILGDDNAEHLYSKDSFELVSSTKSFKDAFKNAFKYKLDDEVIYTGSNTVFRGKSGKVYTMPAIPSDPYHVAINSFLITCFEDELKLNTECKHKWEFYMGLNHRDEYCTVCNKKRDTEKRY